MAGQTLWAVVIVAVIAAALIGFFLGRVSSGGARQRMEELEAETQRQKDEIVGYKREVDAHFDKTASLFVSMAGSYKDLFEHLSSGYEKLSEGSSRDLFRERVATLLLDGPDKNASSNYVHDDDVEGNEAKLAASGDLASDDEAEWPEPVKKVDQPGVDAPGEAVASQTSEGLSSDAPSLEPETAARVEPETAAKLEPETIARVEPMPAAHLEPETTPRVEPETTATAEPKPQEVDEVARAGTRGTVAGMTVEEVTTEEAIRTGSAVDTDDGVRAADVKAEAMQDRVGSSEEAVGGKVAENDQPGPALDSAERKG